MTAARHQKITSIAKPIPAIVDVTPALAEQWLAGNTVNRKIRKAAVNQYASDMSAGRWTLTGDAICFSPDGKLLNGQHRLTAVITSGATVPMLIMRNAPTDAMTNMDAGIKRTAADAFGFDGEVTTHLLAAVVKLALLHTDGRIYKDRMVQSVSPGELRDFLAENPDLRDSVAFTYTTTRSVDLTPTAKAVGHWLFARAADEELADTFFALLSTRVGLPTGSPILALDSRIREMRKNRTRASHREELYLLVKAWNYWRAGRAVRVLVLKGAATIPAVSA